MSSSQPDTLNQINKSSQATVPASLRRIILTGFMGAGKSTIGRQLASRLGWEFLDLDTHLENRTGTTIPDLFSKYGEPHFRRLESTALASALSRTHTVLALGGGAPQEITNRLLIEQTPATFAIFLDAPFPTLFDRCMLQDISRPVLADPSLAEIRFARRRPFYSRLAQLTIETSTQSPEETVEAIVAALNHKTHLLP
jgi:shikimate kinase